MRWRRAGRCSRARSFSRQDRWRANGRAEKSSSLALGHLLEELLVVLRALHAFEEERHRVFRRHVAEEVPDEVDPVLFLLGEEQLFLARSGLEHVDRREHAAIDMLK